MKNYKCNHCKKIINRPIKDKNNLDLYNLWCSNDCLVAWIKLDLFPKLKEFNLTKEDYIAYLDNLINNKNY